MAQRKPALHRHHEHLKRAHTRLEEIRATIHAQAEKAAKALEEERGQADVSQAVARADTEARQRLIPADNPPDAPA